MSDLQQEYGDRVDFVVVDAVETAQRKDEIEAYGFHDLRHGLVAFSSTGEAVVKLPGHEFGKPEITAAIEAVLKAKP